MPKKGRKKITYDPAELERQPMLMIVCGETGVGKTYRNLQEISRYMKGDPAAGRKGRKVLAFDVNDHDYPHFKTVKLHLIQNLTAVNARRVRPINEQGHTMSLEEKRDVVEQMVHRFKNGLLVLEDLDKYMVGAKGQTIVGLLTTNRHNGLDIMISHQSVAKVTTTEWENCTWLRLHHQVDDLRRYENRIPNYFLVRIATLIVDEQYELANQAFQEGRISEQEFRQRKGFCVYVDMRRLKIRGVSREAFVRAAKKYIDTHEQKQLNTLLLERDLDDRPIYPDRKAALIQRIIHYLRHHETLPTTP